MKKSNKKPRKIKKVKSRIYDDTHKCPNCKRHSLEYHGPAVYCPICEYEDAGP